MDETRKSKASRAALVSRRTVIVVCVSVAAIGLAVVSQWVLRRGTASLTDGEPAVAQVKRLEDGSCWVGGRGEHCYRLALRVLPAKSGAFDAALDVNVPDRWASRVQPGAWVWVVRHRDAPDRVSLVLDAFAEPAPTAPNRATP